MKKSFALIGLLWALPVLFSGPDLPLGGHALAAEADERETRKVPAMRERTYKVLSEAQALIDPESVVYEEGQQRPQIQANPQAAIKMLNDLLASRGMNSYEIAQAWNTLAFAYYTLDDVPNTIKAYRAILNETITLALELSSLRALFQLYYSEENYKEALVYIDRWQKLNVTPDPDVTYIKATAYYQLEDYKRALEEALKVEKMVIEQGRTMKESWWYLQVVLYNELKDYPKVINVLEKLIVAFPKKQYWMHLAGMYAETEQDDKALSAYYAAYTQGFFDREGEIVMLSQRLLNAEVPFEAAKVLVKGMKDGIVKEDEKNIRLLATAYTMAQDMDKAIDAWRSATKFAEDGELYYRLAQALSQEDRHKEAVDAYRNAIRLGRLNDVADANFWLGISLMQLENWDDASGAFREAAKDKSKEKSARQYIQYIAGEKRRQEELKRMLEAD